MDVIVKPFLLYHTVLYTNMPCAATMQLAAPYKSKASIKPRPKGAQAAVKAPINHFEWFSWALLAT
jgi:hypothetical protein